MPNFELLVATLFKSHTPDTLLLAAAMFNCHTLERVIGWIQLALVDFGWLRLASVSFGWLRLASVVFGWLWLGWGASLNLNLLNSTSLSVNRRLRIEGFGEIGLYVL